ncbi:MAG: response regulator transcription factor [Oscillospiraceae bacterium]|jgi:DNA-binding response OmpR family regulator
MKKLLVVEDDWELNQGLCYVLEKEGYTTIAAHSLQEARDGYLTQGADLILLDINLPDGDGFSFCKWIRMRQKIPVLFLTARDLEEDVLAGYECGAEDYITKPFSMKILLKKLDVILKRTAEQRPQFDDGFLCIDFDRANVTVNGMDCTVTPTEFRLLREFVEHSGQLLTYTVLLERLWDSAGQFVDKHALAVNVNRLRKKIEDAQHRYISNVYGMGYQWLG